MYRAIAYLVIMVAWPVQADAQGLFEALFGARPSGPVMQYAPLHAAPTVRTAPHTNTKSVSQNVRMEEGSRPKVKRYIEPVKPGPYVPPKEMPGHLGRFLQDPTLRAGDVVATDKGLMVYRGPGGLRHNEKHFASVSSATAVGKDKLPLLLALDREVLRNPTAIAETPRRPASPIVASDYARLSQTQ